MLSHKVLPDSSKTTSQQASLTSEGKVKASCKSSSSGAGRLSVSRSGALAPKSPSVAEKRQKKLFVSLKERVIAGVSTPFSKNNLVVLPGHSTDRSSSSSITSSTQIAPRPMGGCMAKHGAHSAAAKLNSSGISNDGCTPPSGCVPWAPNENLTPNSVPENKASKISGNESPEASVDVFRRRLSLSQSAAVDKRANEDATRGNMILRSPRTPGSPPTQMSQHNGAAVPSRRLSISGILTDTKEDNFADKKLEIKNTAGTCGVEVLVNLGVGYACRKGLKPESPNQDDFFIVRIDDWGMYGVFDGHGPFGHDVSNYVQRELPKLICNDKDFLNNPSVALRNSFLMVHRKLTEISVEHRLDCSLSGTTATVVLHRPSENKLYVGHVGDSRCVVGRLTPNRKGLESFDMTIDHKPNNDLEEKRIIAAGGQVKRLTGDIPHRVFLKGKLYPGLAMSRAIGDTVGAQAGVIPDPDVTVYELDEQRDRYLILCSDGVWEFISSQEAVDVVRQNGLKKIQNSADTLARESWQRWITEEGNVVDDITVQVVCLFPERSAMEEH